jgi:hypothetical protein
MRNKIVRRNRQGMMEMTTMHIRSIIPRLAAVALAAAQLFMGVAFACKDRMYPEQFPLKELEGYAHVYVVRVQKIDWMRAPEGSWYAPPFTFEGKIEKSLKGPMRAGDSIRATTSKDEAHAACAISLQEGKTYLLMLNGATSPYVLPRYGSLHLVSDDELFDDYVGAIARSTKAKGAR